MNLWKLVGPKTLVKSEEPLPGPKPGSVRVRVTKVLLNGQDAALYTGAVRVRYPLIPGRYAVGFVSEEGNPLFPKGTRVVLHGYRPVPLDGVEKRDFSADDYYACGRTVDGFLTDFVMVSPEDMTELPASVSDERGLLLHHIAAAKEIVDKLAAQKGQHVAVVGADLIGILVCKLLIYQQAAPILVDADRTRLDRARACGIYYTIPDGEDLVEQVASVTGGRLCGGAVYAATATGNRTDAPFELCARGGKTVFFATSMNKVGIDLGLALRKHLTLLCVSHGVRYIPTAINLLANKAVDPSVFHANVVRSAKCEELLSEYLVRDDRDVLEINYVDLLQ